ncbi:MAG: IS200/IS605 family transposase [bacterium]
MANTFSQIYIQIVFTVKGRQNLLRRDNKDELHKYMSGIIRNNKQKLLRINSVSDHVHILIGLKPDIALSDLVRDIKANSSRFINEKRWSKGKFHWQGGFGAFSYSHSHLDRVIKYIDGQEAHHCKKTFREEYLSLLEKFQIEYDPRFVFDWIEDDRYQGASISRSYRAQRNPLG